MSVHIASDGTLTWDPVHEQTHPFPLGADKRPTAIICSPLRTRTAMLIREWNKIGDDSEGAEPLPAALQLKLGKKSAAWQTKLRELYSGSETANLPRLILRVADLTFYRTFCLLEVLERLPQSYRRSYALIRLYDVNGIVWTSSDAVALTYAIRCPSYLSLPILDGRPAGTRCGKFLSLISAEQYALFLLIYHWVAWPLFLIWLAALVVRGRQT